MCVHSGGGLCVSGTLILFNENTVTSAGTAAGYLSPHVVFISLIFAKTSVRSGHVTDVLPC